MHHSNKSLDVLHALKGAHCTQAIQRALFVLRRRAKNGEATLKLSMSGVQRLLLTSPTILLHSYPTLLSCCFHSIMSILADRRPAVLFLVNLRLSVLIPFKRSSFRSGIPSRVLCFERSFPNLLSTQIAFASNPHLFETTTKKR